ncbi:unnamed protein product [Allacma fusca]|uniref:Uncharacterized protein n=1 Tax=Allacma fusca TaxID=39272 RepID=A0A8J2LLX8_9HEXA|nr:unnamed protein product [Allacma fusca]
MGKKLNVILVLAVANAFMEIKGFPQASPPSATEEFCGAPPDEAINATVTCIQKLNIKELDMEHFSTDSGRPIDPSFDDKCLSKCVFVDAGLMSDDGEPILEAFKDDFKKYHTEKYHQYLADITSSCFSLAETQFKSTGGAKGNPCKYASTLAQCLAAEEFKICNPDGSKAKE